MNADDAAEPQVGRRNAAGTYIGETVPTRDAASVLLVRDGPTGPEVLLVERHIEADFSGGALVFPGGKVTDEDRDLDPRLWRGVDPGEWCERLGTPGTAAALGLLVAAVRETFEEAGVLLASRDGQLISPREVETPAFVAVRERLCDRGLDFDWRPWLAEQRLVLELGALALFGWWVTPEGQHKRFDTRFFLARLPPGQRPVVDDVETTALRWETPAGALALGARGEATVIFPTRRILTALGRHGSAGEVWKAAAAGEVDQRRTQPVLVEQDGELMVRHPFDGITEPL